MQTSTGVRRLIRNVRPTETVPQIVLTLSHSGAAGGTGPQAHAMAAAGIPDAVSINSGTIPRMPRRITVQLLLAQEPVST